ncbi:Lactoylglutathione lyase / glyoxalase I family protein [Zea mays]|uniref:Lactoylglutathione lyase / glyoxalase I family protein n=2 Tax=Zea mays TaxID=4577 RepID=A0A1D6NVE4_MAIZE|nr:Lactoylglutathione lyase / glyoxalase I family protein [Zea mays]
MAAATLRWVLQLHRDVPRAARFYSEGLDFSVNVCTLRWAELQSGPLKLALMHTNDRCGYCCLFIPRSPRIIILFVAALRCIDGHMLGLYEPA